MNSQTDISDDRSFVNIRSMFREEIHEVLNLIHLSIRELNSRDYSPKQIEKIVSKHNISVLKRGKTIVAELDDRIVGVAKSSNFFFLSSASIQAVFVHPNFARQGIGRALVCELERQAILKKFQNLSVISSITAIDFYVALGYKKLGEMKIYSDINCAFLNKEFRPITILDRLSAIFLIILIFLFFIFINVALILLARSIFR